MHMKILTSFFQKSKKYWKTVLIVLLVGGAIAGYSYKNSRDKALAEVETARVRRGTLKEILTLSGEITAREQSKVVFQTGGKLTQIAVKEGDVVQKGQYLASLDQRQLQKSLQKELNDYMKARWTFDQNKEDYDVNVVSDAIRRIVDKSQFDLNNAVLDVEIQNISKELSVITSPITGIVTSTNDLHSGINIPLGTPIVEIVNPDSLFFSLTADQIEVTTLKEGLTGTLLLDAFLDEDIPGSISRISFTPKSGESSTVYEVEFNFTLSSNSNMKYRSGMTGDVEFVTQEKKNALFIPFKFITEKNGQSFVTVMEGGKSVQRPVETGIDTDADIEIISGLSEGEIVYN